MLRLSLLAEGGSDAVLLAPLEWLLDRDPAIDGYVVSKADFGHLPRPPRSLDERIERSFAVDEPDILLVHRDADAKDLVARREQEILDASGAHRLCVPVVPVLMSEAWFLFDELALRSAAGRPRGSMPLDLPSAATLESEPKPEDKLRDSLRTASGLKGRKLQKFDWRASYHRLSRTIEDFEPLLDAPSFSCTAASLHRAVRAVRSGTAMS